MKQITSTVILPIVLLGLVREFEALQVDKEPPALKNENSTSCNTAMYYERPAKKITKKPVKKIGPRKPEKIVQVQSESRLPPPVISPSLARSPSVKKDKTTKESAETLMKGSQETLARQSAETLMKDSHENYITKNKNTKDKIKETIQATDNIMQKKKIEASHESGEEQAKVAEMKRVGNLSFLDRVNRRLLPEFNAPPRDIHDWPILLNEDQYKLELKLNRRINHPTRKLGGWNSEAIYDIGKACNAIQAFLKSEPVKTPKLMPKMKKFVFQTNGPYEEDNAERLFSDTIYVAKPSPWEAGQFVEIPTLECWLHSYKMPLFLSSWHQGDRIYVFAEFFKYPEYLVVKDFAFYYEDDDGVGHVLSKRPKDVELHKY